MKKSKDHEVPAKPGVPKCRAYDIKVFPESRSGKFGPFADPAATPTKGDFPKWVDYFVAMLGAKLERLNGLQFDLDVDPLKKNKIGVEMGALAAALNIGKSGSSKEMRWPLAGPYVCEFDKATTGFDTFTLDIFFENEPDYRMVVNCLLEVHASTGPGGGDSTSSSYLATGSSGP
jgi:hypothetical protein